MFVRLFSGGAAGSVSLISSMMICSTHEDSILLVAEVDHLHMILVEDMPLFASDSTVKKVKEVGSKQRMKL